MRDAILFVGVGGAKLVKKGVVWVWKGGKWVILEGIPTGAVLASKLYNKVGDALIRGSIKLEYAVSKIKILQRIQNWNYGGGSRFVNQSSKAILKNGYYEVNGFKYSKYYYEKLWNTGRGGSSLMAKEILANAKNVTPDIIKAGFYKYSYNGWEMVYQPFTKEIWHIMPIKH